MKQARRRRAPTSAPKRQARPIDLRQASGRPAWYHPRCVSNLHGVRLDLLWNGCLDGQASSGSMTCSTDDAGVVVPAHALRRAMGSFPTGVTVVSTLGRGGEPVGTTANAVTSLSLDPPLLLVCFARASR